jgi:hypothetical protein
LTFLTASSTALMLDTLAGKLVWSKPVLCSALLAGACRALPPTLTATAERRPPARLVEVCFTIAPCWKPALRGRCASGSLNSSDKARIGEVLTISFLNS